tara:strand:+ start:2054 stop:2173 length:120 start_codon:yes stop_codon:yes gene_type:complete
MKIFKSMPISLIADIAIICLGIFSVYINIKGIKQLFKGE